MRILIVESLSMVLFFIRGINCPAIGTMSQIAPKADDLVLLAQTGKIAVNPVKDAKVGLSVASEASKTPDFRGISGSVIKDPSIKDQGAISGATDLASASSTGKLQTGRGSRLNNLDSSTAKKRVTFDSRLTVIPEDSELWTKAAQVGSKDRFRKAFRLNATRALLLRFKINMAEMMARMSSGLRTAMRKLREIIWRKLRTP